MEPLQPLLHDNPVLSYKVHHVSHRGHGRIGKHPVYQIHLGLPGPIQSFHHLHGHHCPADSGKSVTAVRLFGIYHRVRRRKDFPTYSVLLHERYLMVIGDNHGHSHLLRPPDLISGGNPVVTGNNGIHPVLPRRFNQMLIDSVAVQDSVRNGVICPGAQSQKALV